jgi:hypothetical protein
MSYLAKNLAIWQICLLQETREKLRALTPRRAEFGTLFCVVPVAESATQRHSRGGFRHAATKIAAGALIAEIRSQATRTTAKLEYLKFTNETDLKKK